MRWQRGLWLFLVPSFGLMAVVLLWPLLYAAYLSTFDYYLGSREVRFVGLANYAQLLSETRLSGSRYGPRSLSPWDPSASNSLWVLFSRSLFTGSPSVYAYS